MSDPETSYGLFLAIRAQAEPCDGAPSRCSTPDEPCIWHLAQAGIEIERLAEQPREENERQ